MLSKKLANSLLILFIITSLGSCDFIRFKDAAVDVRKPVARAKGTLLYAEDLEGLVPSEVTGKDSLDRVNKFIQDWVKKQLLIQEASDQIDFEEAEIERKVLDYRYSLMGYEFQQYYIEQHLNTEISDDEIQEYYDQNIDNFGLKQNIVRGKFIKVPVEAPSTNRIKRLIQSNKVEDFDDLKAYCLSFATAYQLYDSVWMVFDDIVKGSPLSEIPNKVQFLRSKKYTESADDDFLYFLKIEEFRISDNISPLEFVRDQVRSIILNKRKVDLAKKLEDDVYQNALKNNEIEIYN